MHDSNVPTRVAIVANEPRDIPRLVSASRTPNGAALDVSGTFPLEMPAGLRHLDCDVLLVDLSCENGRGLERLRAIQALAPHAPIVVLTRSDDEDFVASCLRAGAHDFVPEGEWDSPILSRAIRHAVERSRILGELEAAREQERYLATHDPFTGLPNRQLLTDRLTQALAYADRYGQWVGVLFMDLDRFKSINDTMGHAAGDALLRAVVQRVSRRIRRADTAARFGGDEFVFLLLNIGHAEDAARVARYMIRTVARPYLVDGRTVSITPSIGIAVYPGDGRNARELIANADRAMYRAKQRGGGRYEFFAPDVNAAVQLQLDLESNLATAMARGEFVVHYQPLVDAHSRRISGAEALVRWRHPKHGLIAPDEFIPVAEESGLIVRLGEFVLRTACAQHAAWLEAGGPSIRLAVNISARHFRRADLADTISEVTDQTGMDPELLDLEISESCMVADPDQAAASMKALKKLGVGISVDDFGMEYSSFRALKRCPCDSLKVDRSFVRALPSSEDDVGIANAIIAIGDSMGLAVIAEGVERRAQMQFFLDRECPVMQGHLFSEPLPASTFASLLGQPLRLPDSD